MTPLQHLRLNLGLSVEPTDEEAATAEARYCRLRQATPSEQLALRLRRLRAAGWDAQAHGFDPRRLAGSVETSGSLTAASPAAMPLAAPERRRGREASS